MSAQQRGDYNTVFASLYTKPAPLKATALDIVVEKSAPKRPATGPTHKTAPATEKVNRHSPHALSLRRRGRPSARPRKLVRRSQGPARYRHFCQRIHGHAQTFDASGSGITKTEYSLDGGKTWIAYSEPFTLADGHYQITTRAADKAGTQEEVRARAMTLKTK